MKTKNRFYVGHPNLFNDHGGWRNATLEDAIEKAKELCEKSNRPQIVVKIVAVIEPAKPPAKVTYLK